MGAVVSTYIKYPMLHEDVKLLELIIASIS